MKKTVSFLLLFSILSLLAFGNDVVVENPPFSVRNSKTLEIDKIEISDSETMLYITAYNKPKNWIRIDKGTYIRVNGEKYLIKSAKGIELAKEVYSDETGQMSFTLSFPSIDKNTQSIDFIESDCESCFKIWGIELHEGELKNKIEVPQEAKDALLMVDNTQSLPEPKFEKGEATLSGRVLGYVPEMNLSVSVCLNDPVLGKQNCIQEKIADDGSFALKLMLSHRTEVWIGVGDLYRRSIVMSPQKETMMFLDLQEKTKKESRNRRDKTTNSAFVYYVGANAYINNWLANNTLSTLNGFINFSIMESDIADMKSVLEYKKYVLDNKEILLSEINKLDISGELKEFLTLRAEAEYTDLLLKSKYYIEMAHDNKYKKDKQTTCRILDAVQHGGYYTFLKDTPLNDSKMLYSMKYMGLIKNFRLLDVSGDTLGLRISIGGITSDLIENVKQITNMSTEDIKTADYIKTTLMENWSDEIVAQHKTAYKDYIYSLLQTGDLNENDQKLANMANQMIALDSESLINIFKIVINLRYNISRSKEYSDWIKNITIVTPEYTPRDTVMDKMASDWNKKYTSQINIVMQRNKMIAKLNFLAEYLGSDSGIFFDLFISQSYVEKLNTNIPLKKEELEYIKAEVGADIYNYLNDKNNELQARLDKAKNNNDYTVYSTPEVEDDVLFHEIIKPFEGKVVFVDFWGTWCGPCRSAMKKFEAAKKEFKGKDVVFVYIADETSPEEVWNNMIVLIDGEHYRLSISQFGYLKRKFKFSGVPSYLIIDKKGHQVYERTGFEGADKLSKIINDELSK